MWVAAHARSGRWPRQVLTVLLITMIFYYHPSTTNAVSFFRTVPLLPESSGRVEEIYVNLRDKVKAGQPIFKLDSSKQEAALETARRRIAEVDAAMEQAKVELEEGDGKIQEAQGAYQQAIEELETKRELQRRNASTVAQREIERLENVVSARQGALATAIANKKSVQTQIASLLPAQKASAEAARAEAQVDLDKTVVHALIDGMIEQFTLRKGDIVNPVMRPAGILIPADAGRWGLIAGFGQIEAQVMKPGMIAEADLHRQAGHHHSHGRDGSTGLYRGSGQLRPTDVLVDAQQLVKPGTLTVISSRSMEGGFAGIPPGSQCIANAYTNNHDLLADKNISTGRWLFLHAVDAVALVHALILRLQALVLPLQTLVFSGH